MVQVGLMHKKKHNTKKILNKIIIGIAMLLSLTGCLFYNLNFVMPNDTKFLAIIESIDTPEKICNYMEENFEWEFHLLSFSPYQMWLVNVKARTGDCNDMSNFAVWVAHHHEYEVYQVHVYYEGEFISHLLGVFVEDGKMNYSSNTVYWKLQTSSFKEIAEHNCYKFCKQLRKYKVYNYNMNTIEVYNE